MSTELMPKLSRPPEVRELEEGLNITEAGSLAVIKLYARVDRHSRNEPFAPGELSEGADPSTVRHLRQESFALPIEDRITLYDALDKLSAFQRRLVYLLFFKDLTQTEVAVELGLTQKKVSRESIKALGRLKQLLGRRIF